MQELHKEVGRRIEVGRDALAVAITTRHYELNPELESRYGPAGREKCRQDASYHLSYLAEAIGASSPVLFGDYVAWVRVMLATRGIPAADLASNLDCMHEALRQNLPSEASELVSQYVKAALKRLPQLPAELPPLLDDASPHGKLAQNYLTLLLCGERHLASRLILDSVDAGVSVKEIYLNVFQRTQREIGRLWQMNKINVAQEHYCTASTQLVMSQLYPRIFRSERRGRTLVATSVAGELHELGIRMVADFFEMEGWDTYYLGANTPAQSVLQAVIDRKADVLAVSATMTFHLPAIKELIAAARSSEGCRDLKIIVGGYPFELEPELWRRVGADLYAADAEQATEVTNQLIAGQEFVQ